MSLKILFCLVILVCVCAPAAAQVFPAPEGEMKVGYDRFTDQRKIGLYQLQIAEKNRHDNLDPVKLYISCAVAYTSGTNPQPPEVVGVLFEAWTLWNYEFVGPAPLHAILDGQRRSYGSAVLVRNQIINGKYVSRVGGRMAYSDFQELIKAKTVEIRLGQIEFGLTEKTQGKLRDFAGMITP